VTKPKKPQVASEFGVTGQRYLLTAHSILSEIIDSRNQWVAVSDIEITEETYTSRTTWSDFNTIVPTLFLFYHGLELIAKALLLHDCGERVGNHNLLSLLDKVGKQCRRQAFTDTARKYVTSDSSTPDFLRKFLVRNRRCVDTGKLSELLRYPEDTKAVSFDHTSLHYNGDSIIKDLIRMQGDIKKLIGIAAAA